MKNLDKNHVSQAVKIANQEEPAGQDGNDAIYPHPFAFPDAALDDLRERLSRTRLPERETVNDWSQGAPLARMQRLCDYWRNGYDWRAAEVRLNALDPSMTQLDGLDIHFLHLRSPEPNATPLVMTHGWPGSVFEFLKVAPLLADPRAHGGDAKDAFHVVLPTLPGFGLSGKPDRTGLDPRADLGCVGRANSSARLRPLCRAGRRLGLFRHQRAGCHRRTSASAGI